MDYNRDMTTTNTADLLPGTLVTSAAEGEELEGGVYGNVMVVIAASGPVVICRQVIDFCDPVSTFSAEHLARKIKSAGHFGVSAKTLRVVEYTLSQYEI